MSGHVNGNLNIIATRRGWSRNFTLSPETVAMMDYSTLEALLELSTLKQARARLRIFVEHPAGSGAFVLLRAWKDDGSLQAALVRTFFVERMQNGIITLLDIRDEEPAVPERAREWLKTRALPLGARASVAMSPSTSVEPAAHAPEGDDAAEPITPASAPTSTVAASGFFGFFNRAGPPAPPPKDHPSAPPSPPPSDPEAEMKKEEVMLAERGWKPVLRRLTTRRRQPRKETPSAVIHNADITAEGDGEPVEAPDPREMSADAMATPERPSLFKKGGSVLLGRKRSKKEVKGKSRAPAVAEDGTVDTEPPAAEDAPAEEGATASA
ncbi:hypothetical protein K488DRAFT_70429 [Vararia minispora EC-137]|uniref:Uncharacterized protein n=1 Tax=Vararia minispora EC-137 TaxID=1314806 RepID=A0ACB8QMW4_9AGAM|nr:hypothetical protein K488DRAFT_70429 [Vararia minispora EC-137]